MSVLPLSLLLPEVVAVAVEAALEPSAFCSRSLLSKWAHLACSFSLSPIAR